MSMAIFCGFLMASIFAEWAIISMVLILSSAALNFSAMVPRACSVEVSRSVRDMLTLFAASRSFCSFLSSFCRVMMSSLFLTLICESRRSIV